MKIDETALAAAQGRAADLGWLFHTAQHREDLEAIITAYLAALPKPEQGRDRIAVSRFASGSGVSHFMRAGEHLDWALIESCIDYEEGAAARYIVRANCPPPAELVPVEVEGSVEAALDGFRDGLGAMKVRGLGLTAMGHMAYCVSCADEGDGE